jgi:hypothetical protein
MRQTLHWKPNQSTWTVDTALTTQTATTSGGPNGTYTIETSLILSAAASSVKGSLDLAFVRGQGKSNFTTTTNKV